MCKGSEVGEIPEHSGSDSTLVPLGFRGHGDAGEGGGGPDREGVCGCPEATSGVAGWGGGGEEREQDWRPRAQSAASKSPRQRDGEKPADVNGTEEVEAGTQ